MTATLVLTRADVCAVLPLEACAAAVEEGLRQHACGRSTGPAVFGLHGEEGRFHVKAAGLQLDGAFTAVKMNANFPGNPARHGLPTIQGVLALFDGSDGRVLALFDSAELTAVRTAAATAACARAGGGSTRARGAAAGGPPRSAGDGRSPCARSRCRSARA